MLKENQYTLLKLLLNEHEYQSAEYFAAGLDVSTKTIQNYLQQMEPYFAAHQYQLLRKRGRGLKLLSTVKKDRSETKMEALHQDSASLRRENSNFFCSSILMATRARLRSSN
ncbi:HTH domain [Listeria grayi]|nr:HTH domain [Listeria grayi]